MLRLVRHKFETACVSSQNLVRALRITDSKVWCGDYKQDRLFASFYGNYLRTLNAKKQLAQLYFKQEISAIL